MTTVSGAGQVAVAAGGALGGVVSAPLTLIYILVAINLVAAGVAAAGHDNGRQARGY